MIPDDVYIVAWAALALFVVGAFGLGVTIIACIELILETGGSHDGNG